MEERAFQVGGHSMLKSFNTQTLLKNLADPNLAQISKLNKNKFIMLKAILMVRVTL